ncbi:MAG: YdcF family protein [Limisphaerales bacterium]
MLFLLGSTPLVDLLVVGVEKGVAGGPRPETSAGDGEGATIQNGKSLLEDGNGEAGTVVLVLGGGYYVSDRDPYGLALRDGGTRILTGLELIRAGKASALVLGGGSPVPGRPAISAPSLLQHWIVAWGLANKAEVVTNLGNCMNTHDEAVQFQKLEKVYGWRKVLLVTSALHMPRSVAVFKNQGIEVEPVACDFKIYGVPDARFRFSLFPSLNRFQIFGLYLHEKIGWWVYRVRGWV